MNNSFLNKKDYKDQNEVIKYFKEDIISSVITIPYENQDILNIIDIVTDAKIESYKFLEFKRAISNEGNIITGYKMVVEVLIREKISYNSQNNKNSMCIFFNEELKGFSVALPAEYNGKEINSLIRSKRFLITPYIEKSINRKINNRKIHNSMLVLVDIKLF